MSDLLQVTKLARNRAGVKYVYDNSILSVLASYTVLLSQKHLVLCHLDKLSASEY